VLHVAWRTWQPATTQLVRDAAVLLVLGHRAPSALAHIICIAYIRSAAVVGGIF
jgi:hypothetical protein